MNEVEADQPHPYEHARVCTALSLLIAAVLLIAGALATNARSNQLGIDVGFDWTSFGIWAAAAGIVLIVGVCASSICKQLVDSLTP